MTFNYIHTYIHALGHSWFKRLTSLFLGNFFRSSSPHTKCLKINSVVSFSPLERTVLPFSDENFEKRMSSSTRLLSRDKVTWSGELFDYPRGQCYRNFFTKIEMMKTRKNSKGIPARVSMGTLYLTTVIYFSVQL